MRRRLDVLLREYKRKHSTGGHGGMGKAICKELGKTSVIVLAGRNLAKMEAAKAELDELGVESCLCK